MSLHPEWAAIVTATLSVAAIVLWPTRARVRTDAAAAVLGQARSSRLWNPTRWVRRPRSRSLRVVDVVPLLYGLSASLAAGLTPEESLKMAARSAEPPMTAVLGPVVEAAEEGRPLSGAWQRVARSEGHRDLASLARAWVISERLGCPLADAVATTASTSRARTLLTQRLDSATAGARATCALLTALPIGGVGIALMLGIDPVTLYSSPIALASALVGVCLLLTGRWLVSRMIGGVARAVQ